MRHRWLTMGAAFVCGFWSTLVWAGTSQGVEASDATQIPVNTTVGASQYAEQPVAYLLAAQPGQAYLIELSQQGLDFVITVVNPDGTQQTFNSPLRRDGREFVLLENAQAGAHRIVVNSIEPTNAEGKHELRVTQLKAEESPSQYEAMRLMSEAAAAYATGEREQAMQALQHYERAANLWHVLGRNSEHAQSLYSIAMIEYWIVYSWSRSESFARQAAEVYQALGERQLHANTVYLQGIARIEKANELEAADARNAFGIAIKLLQAAQETHRELENAFELARIQNDLGLTYFYQGDWERARVEWGEAAESFAGLSEWREELNARQNQAVIDGMQGNNARAIETLQYIMDTAPAGKDPQFESIILDNLAENHRLFGNYEEALRKYSEALEIHRSIGDAIGEVNSLRGIGNTYYSFGELALASQYLEQALPLSESANDGRSQQAILSRLGDIAFLRADYNEALRLHRAALDMAISDPDRARRQVRVAEDLAALNLHQDAQVLAYEARDLAETSDSLATLADALVQIGSSHIALGAAAKSTPYFEKALATYESLGLRAGQADAVHGLSAGARALGELDNALRHSSKSLGYIDSLRVQVIVPELRALYSAASRNYYETHIDLLMARFAESEPGAQSHLEAALATSESSRARMVFKLLQEASVGLRTHADSSLLDTQGKLLEELAAKRYQRDRLLNRGMKDGEDNAKLADLLNSMTAVEKDLHLVESELRRTSPGYARISAAEPLDAGHLQALVDTDSVLLQYVLGDERSYVFAVTSDSIQAAELKDRETLHHAITLAVESLQKPPSSASETQLFRQRLASVSDYVLAPVSDQLAGKKRLVLALDGALQYIPFAVLSTDIDGVEKPLVETHEIIVVPSMSVVSTLRSRPEKIKNKSIAVFADPVVEKSDPRFDDVHIATGETHAMPKASMTRSADATLSRLPYSALEATTIADFVPENERYVALGFAANKNQLMSLDLADYRILHFATHGLVDSRYPALSAIVLSRFDERGNPQNGMLRLHDIFDFELNADLVVLSACNTALGREIPGEGLVGLAQGFMYAGANSLLLSLWQVSDRATAELMSRFYENMLKRKLPPSQALKAAQVSLAAEPRWSHAYYWGAFVVLGDWL